MNVFISSKPLLRGWFHAIAAVGTLISIITLLVRTYGDGTRTFVIAVFGVSLVLLYIISATYHLGNWHGRTCTVLRKLDHSGIFVLIAATYTPFCILVLNGALRWTVLMLIWVLALAGIASTVLPLELPRWARTARYLGMGWVAVIPFPHLLTVLPLTAIGWIAAGGLLHTFGGIIYALRRPNPLPRIFGYHEIFHLLVIGGNTAFLIVIWHWVVPFKAI